MLLVASDITSMVFAVKLAMYRTPRDSSSARSMASPPITTTCPKVPPRAALDASAAPIDRIAQVVQFVQLRVSPRFFCWAVYKGLRDIILKLHPSPVPIGNGFRSLASFGR